MRTLAAPRDPLEWSLFGRFEDGCKEQRVKHCGFLCRLFPQHILWSPELSRNPARRIGQGMSAYSLGGPGFASWGPASMEVDTEEHLL